MWRKWTWMFAPLLAMAGPALAAQQEQPVAAGAATSAEDCRPADIKLQFGFDSDSLDDMSRRSLDSAAAWLQESPNRRLRLEGYADPSGATTYNDDLSYRRADAAKRHLVAQGIDPSRVNAVGQGEMAPAGLAGGSQQRAVMVLYCEGPAAAPTTGEAAPPAAPTEPPVEAEAAPAPEPETLAQAEPMEEIPPAPPPPMTSPITETAVAEEPPSGLEAIGLGVSLGGGVAGFTDEEARDIADVGGAWDVRVVLGTRLPVAFEAAYTGSAQNIEAFGLDTDTFLLGNGAEGALRFQLPTKYVMPYILVGLGWTHYSLTNTDTNASLLENSDDVLTMPLGLGLTAFSVFGGTFDLRGVIRPTWQESMFDDFYSGTGTTADLHNWNVTGNLGWNF